MSPGTRRTASIALTVIGGVLALVGGAALYAREEVFDADSFADHAVETLEEREVREALAEPIVGQAIDSGPDQLINAEPLLRTAVEGALESNQFKGVLRKGARKAHKGIFEKEGEKLCLINTRVLMMRDGRVIFSGSNEQLDKSDDPYIRRFIRGY